MIHYFAYGSNMNPTRMQERCPGAVALGKALLRNYRLAERLYADIDFEKGAETGGVLYSVSTEHLQNLDYYEGCPDVYKRILVDVECDGQIYQAIAYEQTLETKTRRTGKLYDKTYQKICSGGADYYGVKNGFSAVKFIVYGTLMSEERNHRFCRNAIRITPCTITGTLYDTGYGFPAFSPHGTNTVKAELIELPLRDWNAVDALEGYPDFYNRSVLSAKLPDGAEALGWVYIMNSLPESSSVIKGGDWKNRRK